MPRKAKELLEEEKKEVKTSAKKTVSKKVSAKKATTKKVAEKKETTSKKKTVSKSAAVEKETTAKKKTSTKDSTIKEEITPESKVSSKKVNTKTPSTKKTSSKKVSTTTKKEPVKKAKSTVKKSSTSTKRTRATSNPITMLEYYDLPSRYSQTVVKILAQTPKMLFVYWDISEEDRNNYITQYGEDFFNNTVPFLRVKNQTENYTFEVDVDDFANSWYLPINDAKCTYSIELLRKQKPNMNKVIEHDIYIVSSNHLEAPNDHILFEKQQKMVYFKNVKNNTISSKDVSTLTFIQNIGKIYNIYDFYKTIYQKEDINEMYDLSNPSSNSSSGSVLDNLN